MESHNFFMWSLWSYVMMYCSNIIMWCVFIISFCGFVIIWWGFVIMSYELVIMWRGFMVTCCVSIMMCWGIYVTWWGSLIMCWGSFIMWLSRDVTWTHQYDMRFIRYVIATVTLLPRLYSSQRTGWTSFKSGPRLGRPVSTRKQRWRLNQE